MKRMERIIRMGKIFEMKGVMKFLEMMTL